ncbi:OmpA/MotB domain-containing protein [Candidatus Magnetomorum sp. HK-1]|nr:OmpA/MotB domain-containing protein [Candidatus Magnetomorum sp. HK-1]
MKKQTIILVVLSGLLLQLWGCATSRPFTPKDLNEKFNMKDYVQKANHLYVILDASGSMAYFYNYRDKLTQAKEILSHMNKTLPEIPMSATIRTFGKKLWTLESETTKVYLSNQYRTEEFDSAIKKIGWPSGQTLLHQALASAQEELKSRSGNIAILIVSDGKDMDDSTLSIVKLMKKSMGDHLGVYGIHVGDSSDGHAFLDTLTKSGGGFVEKLADISEPDPMADFVNRVFYERFIDTDLDGIADKHDNCPETPEKITVDKKGCPFDTDKDGIYDYLDDCQKTPKDVTVDNKGCPLDEDGDGVPDYLDLCQNTPKGAPINDKGCVIDADSDGVFDHLDQCERTPKEARVDESGCWIIQIIHFKSNQKNIQKTLYPYLEEITKVLIKNPSMHLGIYGHTDSSGRASYNLKLSKRRAQAVANELLKMGISKDRLMVEGYGHTRPIATNKTKEGRSKNRRVEFKIIWE